MKLLRHGLPGREKPGLLDAGNVIRLGIAGLGEQRQVCRDAT